MKKYQVNDRVFVVDSTGKIPGTITDIKEKLYKVEYDCGGYDWLLSCEFMPLEYCVGDYVETINGIGRIQSISEFFFGIITVTYGKHNGIKSYYEHELRPAQKPSLIARLLKRDTYLRKGDVHYVKANI